MARTAQTEGRPTLRLRGGATTVDDPVACVRRYDEEMPAGARYYEMTVVTPIDRVTLEDLGYGVLSGGQPRVDAALALLDDPPDLAAIPTTPLARLDEGGVAAVVDAIVELMARRGFGCALATRVLHKKRPATVPVMDDRATFATYLDRTWRPGRSPWPARAPSVRDRYRIADAVELIRRDVGDPANRASWKALKREFPGLTRLELLDKVWWATAHTPIPTPR